MKKIWNGIVTGCSFIDRSLDVYDKLTLLGSSIMFVFMFPCLWLAYDVMEYPFVSVVMVALAFMCEFMGIGLLFLRTYQHHKKSKKKVQAYGMYRRW